MRRQERETAGATCGCCRWSTHADDCSLYNELIFDATILASSEAFMLAHIEAVIYPADRVRYVEDFARVVHHALRRVGVEVPLVEYNGLLQPRSSKEPALLLIDND